MSDNLSDSEFERIDAVCLKFEAAWKNGECPRMDDYLGDAQGTDRSWLFYYLLDLDVYYRQRGGTDPNCAEYHARFPEFAATIDSVFSKPEADDGPPPGETAEESPKAGASKTVDIELCVICPDCGSSIQVSGADSTEVTCPECGSTVQVDKEATLPQQPSDMPETIGRFRVLEVLGKGGEGLVYKAYDPQLKVNVAIKEPRPEHFDTKERKQRFYREARNARSLDHPNIVRAHDVEHDDEGKPYIVYDYIHGRSLADELKKRRLRKKRFKFREAAKIVRPIADALEYAHGQEIYHRDVKPGNILIERGSRRPYLTDFGLATHHKGDETFTETGRVLGTFAYMPPEQAKGEKADARSDVYGLGAVLYELLTDQRPFGSREADIAHRIVHDEPAPPRKLNRRVPRDLETICLKCLEKEPSRRYASARELADDLQNFLDHDSIRARPIGRPARVWRWCRRNPVVAGLIAAVVILVIALLVSCVIFAISLGRLEEERNALWRRALVMKVLQELDLDPAKAADDPAELEELHLITLAELQKRVIELLRAEEPTVRVEAARRIGEFGPDAKDFPVVLEVLELAKDTDSSSDVRNAAAEALRKISVE
ncbi:MAG: protein kinase domain-containing protein [Planctomycetota bacterium]|jgi:serine/threonine-protein kinase